MAKQLYERQRVRLTSGCTTEGHWHDLSSTWDKLYFFIRYPYHNFNKCGTLTLLTSKGLGAWPRTIWSFHSDSVNGHKGLTLDSMHCFYS